VNLGDLVFDIGNNITDCSGVQNDFYIKL